MYDILSFQKKKEPSQQGKLGETNKPQKEGQDPEKTSAENQIIVCSMQFSVIFLFL